MNDKDKTGISIKNPNKEFFGDTFKHIKINDKIILDPKYGIDDFKDGDRVFIGSIGVGNSRTLRREILTILPVKKELR